MLNAAMALSIPVLARLLLITGILWSSVAAAQTEPSPKFLEAMNEAEYFIERGGAEVTLARADTLLNANKAECSNSSRCWYLYGHLFYVKSQFGKKWLNSALVALGLGMKTGDGDQAVFLTTFEKMLASRDRRKLDPEFLVNAIGLAERQWPNDEKITAMKAKVAP